MKIIKEVAGPIPALDKCIHLEYRSIKTFGDKELSSVVERFRLDLYLVDSFFFLVKNSKGEILMVYYFCSILT